MQPKFTVEGDDIVLPAGDISHLESTKPASTSGSQQALVENELDRERIDVLVQVLSSAFSHRSIAELQEICTRIHNKEALKKSFESAESVRRDFHIERVVFDPEAHTAVAVGTYVGKTISGGKESTDSGSFMLRLSKRNGNWYIVEAEF